MKVRALAGLSGPMGSKRAGDEFIVAAELGADLIQRKLIEEVPAEAAPAEVAAPKSKAAKAKE